MKLTKRGKLVRNVLAVIVGLVLWEAATAVADDTEIPTPVVKVEAVKEITFPLEAWSPAVAKVYAKYALEEFGWGDAQFACLNSLWTKESHWNWKAKSPTNDYGIPQRNMPDKTDAEIKKFLSDPIGQISWGLGYIDHRYKSPCNAKVHSDRVGWY